VQVDEQERVHESVPECVDDAAQFERPDSAGQTRVKPAKVGNNRQRPKRNAWLAGFQRGAGDGSAPADISRVIKISRGELVLETELTYEGITDESETAGEEPSGLADGAAQWEGASRGSSATYGSSSAILSTTT
jgi:hypothetical protein